LADGPIGILGVPSGVAVAAPLDVQEVVDLLHLFFGRALVLVYCPRTARQIDGE